MQAETERRARQPNLTVLPRPQFSNGVTWLGVSNYESRSVGSLRRILETGTRVEQVVLVDYEQQRPVQDKERLQRMSVRESFKALCSKADCDVVKKSMGPFVFNDMYKMALSAAKGGSSLVVDLTAMTKIHVLALASVLGKYPTAPWLVAYTIPDSYGYLDAFRLGQRPHRQAWRDVIVAPFGDSNIYPDDLDCRGIILVGNEPDRLLVGISEIEPAGGIIVLANCPRRPDFLEAVTDRNRNFLRRLTMSPIAQWRRAIVDVDRPDSMRDTVRRQVSLARESSGPVVMFPFGPKASVFAAAFELTVSYLDMSWFVYPVPSGYSIDYSEGDSNTLWFSTEGR